MNSMMIKTLGFSALLMIATVGVIMSLDIDIFADSITSITIAGALAIAAITSYVTTKYINQIKTDTASGQLVEETWDGIGEYKNEMPSGWAYMFLATFIWSFWYGFFGYPVYAYSQIGEYNEEVLAYNEKFEKMHASADKSTLESMGRSIYFVQCAQCHGNEADGLSGKAQNLTKRMSKTQILDVINNGSNQLNYPMGEMPAGMAFGEDADKIASYLASGMKTQAPDSFSACTSCHGEDGKGMDGMSPDLTAYDETLMTAVLQHGKKGSIGRMPSFKSLLNPVQEKALAAYIQSIQE
jgi:cytochrome c oxidase cbb3-type subunit 3